MASSNIVAGSNVYLSKTDDPRLDPNYIAQILDYDLLKAIIERRKVDRRIPLLSKEQMSIVHRGIRCTFAKNDPCIGYVEGEGIRVKCINVNCPGIKDRPSFYGTFPWKGCNPDVTEEYIRLWTPNSEEIKRYGNPKKLSRYYYVDMISDEEMKRYDSQPKNEGFEYPIPKEPEPSLSPYMKEKIYKIDPKTGRKMVVIGRRLVITDNASYESDELIPIWGFVDEVEEEITAPIVSRKKAKRIQKKQDEPVVRRRKSKVSDFDSEYSRREEFEKAVSSNIVEEIKLTDIEQELFEEESTIILCDNPAERSFISGTLLTSSIPHSILIDGSLRLALIDEYMKFIDYERVIVSSTVLKAGCKETNVPAWKNLATKNDIARLQVAEREFYKFVYGNQESRWTCRNMYGVTHVCIGKDDIIDLEDLSDGIYGVSFVENGDTYMIIDKREELLGYTSESFMELINALIDSNEISGKPAKINGIALKMDNGMIEILGMGHLKFSEY